MKLECIFMENWLPCPAGCQDMVMNPNWARLLCPFNLFSLPNFSILSTPPVLSVSALFQRVLSPFLIYYSRIFLGLLESGRARGVSPCRSCSRQGFSVPGLWDERKSRSRARILSQQCPLLGQPGPAASLLLQIPKIEDRKGGKIPAVPLQPRRGCQQESLIFGALLRRGRENPGGVKSALSCFLKGII